MNTQERIEELQEKMQEFILEHSDIGQRSVSWGEILELQWAAELEWNQTDEGKELATLLEGRQDEEFPVYYDSQGNEHQEY